MDDEDYEEVTAEIKGLPVTFVDFLIPITTVFAAIGTGIKQSMTSLTNTLVSHSLYKADEKALRARNRADREALKVTQGEIDRLYAEDFDGLDGR